MSIGTTEGLQPVTFYDLNLPVGERIHRWLKRDTTQPSTRLNYAAIAPTVRRPRFPACIRNFPDCLRIRRDGLLVQNPDNYLGFYQASALDSENKSTEKAISCIISLLAGRSLDGLPISQVVHMAPGAFLHRDLLQPYLQALVSFREQTVSGSRSGTILGGTFYDESFKSDELDTLMLPRRYLVIIATLATMHQEILKTEPDILAPKTYYGTTNLYFDNDQQTGYVIETGQQSAQSPEMFRAEDLPYVLPIWKARYPHAPLTDFMKMIQDSLK